MDEYIIRFKNELEKLSRNDLIIIETLGKIATEAKETDAVHKIADLTCRNVFQSTEKLVSLYVLDCIIKSVGQPYINIFAKNLITVFENAFTNTKDEKARSKLYSLRLTWKHIFPNDKLYNLDKIIKQIDPNWPIVAKPPSVTSQDTTPQTSHSTSKSTPSTSSANQQIHVNPKFIRPSNMTVKSEAADTTDEVTKRPAQTATVLTAVPEKTYSSRDPRIKSNLSPNSTLPYENKSKGVKRKSDAPLEESKPPSKSNTASHRGDGFIIDRVGLKSDSESTNGTVSRGICNEELIRCSEEKLKSPSLSDKEKEALQRYLTELRGISNTVKELERRDTPVNLVTSTSRPISALDLPGPPHSNLNVRRPVPSSLPPAPVSLSSYNTLRTQPSNIPVARWTVEIEGYDCPNIGIDPRLLNLVPQPKKNTFIRINEKLYALHLERLQPLVTKNGRFHAVRFRTGPVSMYINGRLFKIPPVGPCRIVIGQRPYVACLGGPAHELIIDGMPHTVSFRNDITYIKVDGHVVCIRPVPPGPESLDILDPIPPMMLQWAACSYFGNARYLHRSPHNPLIEAERHEIKSLPSRAYPTSSYSHGQQNFPSKGDRMMEEYPKATVVQQPHQPNPPYSQSVPPVANAKDLYDKLVIAGFIKPDNVNSPLIDLRDFSLEQFKKPNQMEIEALFSGFQCVQCSQRFPDPKSEDYTKHLDYHFFKNSTYVSGSRHRNHYQELQVWLSNSEIQLDEDGTESDAIPGIGESSDLSLLSINGGGNSGQQEFRCKAYSDNHLNVCDVCKETFHSVWDDEEEEWMLQNAILQNDKVFHPVCLDDAGKEFAASQQEAINTSESTTLSEPNISQPTFEDAVKSEETDSQQHLDDVKNDPIKNSA